jgi:PAS domain S-box-containing protein
VSRCAQALACAALVALTLGPRDGVSAPSRLRFKALSVQDGLPASWVRALVRDSRGFLWLGTDGGLARYDGYEVRSYATDERGAAGLGAHPVRTLFEDSRHQLWVGTFADGLALYDRAHDRLVAVPTAASDGASAGGEVINAIVEDRDGTLWVATSRGLLHLDATGKVIERLHHNPLDPETLINDNVWSLTIDERRALWVGTYAGLSRRDPRTGRFRGFRAAPGGLSSDAIRAVLADGKGHVWVATRGGGLDRVDLATEHITWYKPNPRDPGSISHLRLECLALDQQGHLLVGTENGGLNVLDIGTGRFTHYAPDIDDDTSLNNGSVHALFVDSQGILWVGTYAGGVNYAIPLRFDTVKARHGALSAPSVKAVIEDRAGSVWVGTDGGGLDRIDAVSGRVSYYRHDPLDPTSLPTDAVLSLCEDHRGVLWVGTYDGGLARLDRASGRFRRYVRPPGDPEASPNNIWRIAEEPSGTLLVASGAGLDRFDPATGRFVRIQGGGNQVRAIARSRDGSIWAGGYQGIRVVDAKSGEVRTSLPNPQQVAGQPSNIVQALLLDSRANLWLGTDDGLCRHDASSGSWRRWTTADGLPSRAVRSILEDDQGNLWLGTGKGLVRFVDGVGVPAKPRFVAFDVRDGLQGYDFTAAAYHAASGRLYFGGQKGLSWFVPGAIVPNLTPPPVVLTGLRINNMLQAPGAPGSRLGQPLSEVKKLTLKPGDRVVTFEFAALNFILPEKNQYEYWLEGMDTEWGPVGAQRSATYTNLSPRDYIFHVRATNNDGAGDPQGIALALTVEPPWWWSRLALIVWTCLAAALAVGLFRWRVRATEARRRELEALVERRTAELDEKTQQAEASSAQLLEKGRELERENQERRRAEDESREAAQRAADSNRELMAQREALQNENRQRRKAEEEAGRERDLLHALMDNIPDLIYFKDVEGRFTRVNRAHSQHLARAEPEELVGKTDRDFFAADFAADALDGEQRLLRSGEPLIGKVEHDERLGRWLLATKVPLKDAQGKVVGLVGISKDITDRKRAEEQLEADMRAFLAVVSAVAQGDLAQRGAEGEDTLGRIARSVNGMLGSVSSTLFGVRDAAFSVSSAATEILAAATEIAKGSQYGNEQVQSASTAVEEMAATMAQVSDHAQRAADAAQQVLGRVDESDHSVSASVHGMGRIDEAVAQTVSKMGILEKGSNEIFEIVDLIDGIASQSKLLALNAAIEAAHAGEAGAGFGVVAEEIRRLAERSTEAISNVSRIVEAIVAETRSVHEAMEAALAEVKGGREVAEQARSGLGAISTLARESAELASHISGAASEQAKVTQTLVQSMQAIANITHESAAGASQTSRAVRELVELSEQLTQAISRFRLAE